MRQETDVENCIDQYADMVQRICLCYMKNKSDCEDIFQKVFLKYMMYDGSFSSEEHRKAWLIRVAINSCKDELKSGFWSRIEPINSLSDVAELPQEENSDVIEAVLGLQKKYREVIYLFYYEEYTALEIAEILDKKENTVYSLLSRGRKLLKKKLGDGFDE